MFLKNPFILFFTALISVVSCSADIEVENGNSLLWKIEGNDCKTSYLFGTMHIIDEEYYKMSESLIKKIETSEAIIMEVGGMPSPFETLELMTLDSGTVHSYFTKEQMATLLEFFDKKLKTSPETFHQLYGKMKPFFILQAISQGYFSDKTVSYDLNIMGMAAEKKIPLIGLETIEQQLGFFDAIPPSEMADLIMKSIADFDEEKKQTKKMMQIYSEQQVDKLIPMIKKQSPEFMVYEDIFLYNRNKAWIPKLKDEMSTKHCFIAVGAAHLFGEGGIIDLLQKEGYSVTAISTE